MPLSFVFFLICDRGDFLPVILGVEKTTPCDTWVSLVVVFGDGVFLSSGTGIRELRECSTH